MISRTPEQRRFYDARLKWELDENSRMQAAFEEGEARGEALAKAEAKISQKRDLQNILGVESSDIDYLRSITTDGLDQTIASLMSKLRSRLL